MAHKLLTGCAPTSALGDAEFTGLANVQKNIESNKIPDGARSARELAELKEGFTLPAFSPTPRLPSPPTRFGSILPRAAPALPRPSARRHEPRARAPPSSSSPSSRRSSRTRSRYSRRSRPPMRWPRPRSRACAKRSRRAMRRSPSSGRSRPSGGSRVRARTKRPRSRASRPNPRCGGRMRFARQTHQVRGGRDATLKKNLARSRRSSPRSRSRRARWRRRSPSSTPRRAAWWRPHRHPAKVARPRVRPRLGSRPRFRRSRTHCRRRPRVRALIRGDRLRAKKLGKPARLGAPRSAAHRARPELPAGPNFMLRSHANQRASARATFISGHARHWPSHTCKNLVVVL